MKHIIDILPKGAPLTSAIAHVRIYTNNLTENRQTMLFSATQTTKVADLARISLRAGPIHVDVDKEEAASTVTTLSQGYVVCQSDQRFLLLYTFLQKNRQKKVIVFFSSCNSVKYHAELLNYIDCPVLDLHVSIVLLFSSLFCFVERQVTARSPPLRNRVSKSNKNVPTPSSSSAMRLPVSLSAPMSQRAV